MKNLKISDETHQALKVHAATVGVKIQDLAEEILKAALKKQPKKKP